MLRVRLQVDSDLSAYFWSAHDKAEAIRLLRRRVDGLLIRDPSADELLRKHDRVGLTHNEFTHVQFLLKKSETRGDQVDVQIPDPRQISFIAGIDGASMSLIDAEGDWEFSRRVPVIEMASMDCGEDGILHTEIDTSLIIRPSSERASQPNSGSAATFVATTHTPSSWSTETVYSFRLEKRRLMTLLRWAGYSGASLVLSPKARTFLMSEKDREQIPRAFTVHRREKPKHSFDESVAEHKRIRSMRERETQRLRPKELPRHVVPPSRPDTDQKDLTCSWCHGIGCIHCDRTGLANH